MRAGDPMIASSALIVAFDFFKMSVDAVDLFYGKRSSVLYFT